MLNYQVGEIVRERIIDLTQLATVLSVMQPLAMLFMKLALLLLLRSLSGVYIFVLPIIAITNLKLQSRKKIGLIAIFTSGHA